MYEVPCVTQNKQANKHPKMKRKTHKASRFYFHLKHPLILIWNFFYKHILKKDRGGQKYILIFTQC